MAKEEYWVCDRCGKKEHKSIDESDFIDNTWWEINLGRAGYGSKLDGCEVKFTLCDDCLFKIFNSLSKQTQKRILDSSIFWGGI